MNSKAEDMMTFQPKLAIIGGSGLYNMPGLDETKEFDLDTPFGKPSAPIIVGILEGQAVAFLARHGIGHTTSPSQINYRANIYALKMLGGLCSR
jgi:5'-methylthioadenosine phosphorylase